jgi:hypothetical protein
MLIKSKDDPRRWVCWQIPVLSAFWTQGRNSRPVWATETLSQTTIKKTQDEKLRTILALHTYLSKYVNIYLYLLVMSDHHDGI